MFGVRYGLWEQGEEELWSEEVKILKVWVLNLATLYHHVTSRCCRCWSLSICGLLHSIS